MRSSPLHLPPSPLHAAALPLMIRACRPLNRHSHRPRHQCPLRTDTFQPLSHTPHSTTTPPLMPPVHRTCRTPPATASPLLYRRTPYPTPAPTPLLITPAESSHPYSHPYPPPRTQHRTRAPPLPLTATHAPHVQHSTLPIPSPPLRYRPHLPRATHCTPRLAPSDTPSCHATLTLHTAHPPRYTRPSQTSRPHAPPQRHRRPSSPTVAPQHRTSPRPPHSARPTTRQAPTSAHALPINTATRNPDIPPAHPNGLDLTANLRSHPPRPALPHAPPALARTLPPRPDSPDPPAQLPLQQSEPSPIPITLHLQRHALSTAPHDEPTRHPM
jgi:hypothetical protein